MPTNALATTRPSESPMPTSTAREIAGATEAGGGTLRRAAAPRARGSWMSGGGTCEGKYAVDGAIEVEPCGTATAAGAFDRAPGDRGDIDAPADAFGIAGRADTRAVIASEGGAMFGAMFGAGGGAGIRGSPAASAVSEGSCKGGGGSDAGSSSQLPSIGGTKPAASPNLGIVSGESAEWDGGSGSGASSGECFSGSFLRPIASSSRNSSRDVNCAVGSSSERSTAGAGSGAAFFSTVGAGRTAGGGMPIIVA
jgi:hypothetical protein